MTSGARRPAPGGVLVTVSSLARILVITIFLLTFLFQTYRIPSGSMIPTLEVGDFVLVSKTAFRGGERQRWWSRVLPPAPVSRGDLAVFHFPPDPTHLLVKRVIGLPGDRLRLRNGRVLLNDRSLEEQYAVYAPARPNVFRDEFPNLHETDPNVNPAWWLALRRSLRTDGNLLVPAGQYFVLGDNRNNSEDSRYWGFVPAAALIGRPLAVYWAVPNGADAPPGGPAARLRWVGEYLHQRIGVLR